MHFTDYAPDLLLWLVLQCVFDWSRCADVNDVTSLHATQSVMSEGAGQTEM